MSFTTTRIRGDTWYIKSSASFDMAGGYLQVSVKENRQTPDAQAALHQEFGPLPAGVEYTMTIDSDLTAAIEPKEEYYWDVKFSDRSVSPEVVETFTDPDAKLTVKERTTIDP